LAWRWLIQFQFHNPRYPPVPCPDQQSNRGEDTLSEKLCKKVRNSLCPGQPKKQKEHCGRKTKQQNCIPAGGRFGFQFASNAMLFLQASGKSIQRMIDPATTFQRHFNGQTE